MQPTGVAQSVLNRGVTPASVVLQIVVPANLLCRRMRKDAACVMVCGGKKKISVLSHGSALTMLTNSVPVRALQLKLALDFKDLTKTEVMWCC